VSLGETGILKQWHPEIFPSESTSMTLRFTLPFQQPLGGSGQPQSESEYCDFTALHALMETKGYPAQTRNKISLLGGNIEY
jgi:hypothetical protein